MTLSQNNNNKTFCFLDKTHFLNYYLVYKLGYCSDCEGE